MTSQNIMHSGTTVKFEPKTNWQYHLSSSACNWHNT